MRFLNHRFQKWTVAILLVFVAATLSSVILAQHGHGRHQRMHHGKMMGGVCQALDLTDEQQQQMTQIRDQQHARMQEQAEQMRAARMAMFDAVHAFDFDEAAIRQAAADLAALEADLAVARASVIQQMHQILTPEQLEQAQELRDEMRERHAEFDGWGRGPGHGRGRGPGHGCGPHADCPLGCF